MADGRDRPPRDLPKAPAARGKLRSRDLFLVAASVCALYGGLLFAKHRAALRSPPRPACQHWDHPEPNYLVSPGVGEFWSALTTIPIAGTALLFQGVWYRYGPRVMAFFIWACCMYTLACASHTTLQRPVFTVTVSAVCNAIHLVFVCFASVAHPLLKSLGLRVALVAAANSVILPTIATLPYAVEHGGVWTLFAVQTPGVLVASLFAAALFGRAATAAERTTFGISAVAGGFLSAAMALSLVECLYGFSHGCLSERFYGFPWMHVAIHTLEQVGIYLVGVSVAALDQMLVKRRPGAEIAFICGGLVPFLHRPDGVDPVKTAAAATATATARVVGASEASGPAAPGEARDVTAEQKRISGARRRAQSPGARPGGEGKT